MILRDLKACDVFPMVAIIKKIGISEIKDHLTLDMIKDAMSDGADQSAIGYSVIMELAGIVIEHLPDCESEVFRFMSNLSGQTIAELQDLPIGEFLEGVIDVFKKKEFKDFFQVVSKYLQ